MTNNIHFGISSETQKIKERKLLYINVNKQIITSSVCRNYDFKIKCHQTIIRIHPDYFTISISTDSQVWARMEQKIFPISSTYLTFMLSSISGSITTTNTKITKYPHKHISYKNPTKYQS